MRINVLWRNPRKVPVKKTDFQKVAGYVTIIFVLIGGGFTAGQFFKGAALDNDKLRLERHTIVLSDTIERLRARLRTDSSSRRNFIRQNTQYLLFNIDSLDTPVISVANATIAPCLKGDPDGCWKSDISAQPGDLVGIQIYFNNAGTTPVANVSLWYNLEYSNLNKTVICRGGIAMGNMIAFAGVAHIYSTVPIKLTYLPEQIQFYRTIRSDREIINADTLSGIPNYKIGTIPTGENSQGVLILGFRVDRG